MTKIVLPIYWTKEFKTKKDKTTLVGMNWYRNAYFIDQNKMKKHFHSLIKKTITKLQRFTTVRTLHRFVLQKP